MLHPGKTITLPSGKEIKADLNKITRKEWVSLYDFKQSDNEGDKIMAKVFGIEPEELDDMGAADYNVAIQSVYKFMDELRAQARKLDDPKA